MGKGVSRPVVTVEVVVVVLPQAPEDNPHKCQSCAWKADEVITVDVYVCSLSWLRWVGWGHGGGGW